MSSIEMPGPADILLAALPDRGMGEFEDLSLPLQEYPTIDLLKRNTHTVHGSGFKRRIGFETQGTARHVDMYEPDVSTFKDVMREVTQDIRITEGHYVVNDIEIEEAGSNAEAVVDLARLREQGCNADIVALQEDDSWSAGPATSSDKKTPIGIPYSILKGTSTAIVSAGYGWEARAPSGHTAGRFGMLHSRHANWAERMSAWTVGDAILSMKRMWYKTKFKSSIPNAIQGTSKDAPQRAIYTNWTAKNSLETLGEQSGENKTHELAWWKDTFTFRGTEVQCIPKLDEDTTNPVYFIDHGTFMYLVLSGFEMRRTIKKQFPDHLTTTVYKNLIWNTFCMALRRNGVMHTPAS